MLSLDWTLLISTVMTAAKTIGVDLHCRTDDTCFGANCITVMNSGTGGIAVGQSVAVVCTDESAFEDGTISKNKSCQLVVDNKGNVYPDWQTIGDCKALQCPFPASIPNSMMITGDVTVGSTTEYLCLREHSFPSTGSAYHLTTCTVMYTRDNKRFADWSPRIDEGCSLQTAY